MQPPAWASWRLAAVAVVCIAAALLVSASSHRGAPGAGPAPRSLGARLVVRDSSGDDAPAASSAHYDRDDSAALVEAFFASGGRVVAFIFFGRRRYTAVQWPYLLQARRADGAGLLSQVIYAANTHDKEDLAWLDQVQAAHADFVVVKQPERVVSQGQNNADYCALYREVVLGSDDAGKTLVIKVRPHLVAFTRT